MYTFYNDSENKTSMISETRRIRTCIFQAIFTVLILFLCTLSVKVYADANPKIYEIDDESDEVFIYVGGNENDFSVSEVQIDGVLMDDISSVSFKDSDNSFRTLIMIDNSLSVPKKHRANVIDLAKGITSGIETNETIRIALIGEDISYISDYSNDTSYLEEIIDSIQFANQDSFLCDALYTALGDLKEEPGFDRIIIISDGADQNKLGITDNELYSALDNIDVQIYTIGLLVQNNSDMLKSMFALARYTNGKDILLDETDIESVLNTISEDDRSINVVKIVLPEELKNGGTANAQLVLGNGEKLKFEINLPFGIARELEVEKDEEQTSAVSESEEPAVSVSEKTDEIETSVETNVDEAEVTSDKKKDGKGGFPFIPVVLIILAASVYFLFFKNKKKTNIQSVQQSQPYSSRNDSNMTVVEQIRSTDNDETVIDSFATAMGSVGKRTAVTLVLTREDKPNERYSCLLDKQVTIGRKHTGYGMIIDCDYSISKSHCIIYMDRSGYIVQDLNSTNGTFVNGEEITGTTEIRPGDRLKLGRISFIVSFE